MTRVQTLRVAVLGSGLMGSAIAAECARAGHHVRLTSSPRITSDTALARAGVSGIEWSPSTGEAAEDADMVIEALPECLEVKQRELATAQLNAPEAILGSNTSSFRIAEIAVALPDPSRLVGVHFINPPASFALVELIESKLSDPDVVARASAMLRAFGKTPVRIRQDVPGFAFNRLQFALLREAIALVDAGVIEAADLDRLVTEGLGRRWAAVGPLAGVELGGAALFQQIAEQLYPNLSNSAQPPDSLRRVHLSEQDIKTLRERRTTLVQALARSDAERDATAFGE